MYGKHFAQMYTGSMYGIGPVVFAVWGYVISHTTVDGQVELNARVIAPTLGCTESEIETAIATLSGPDPRSRSKEHEGRRLIQIGEYLYTVPTYAHYRSIRNDDERRAYNRTKQQESRAHKKSRRVKARVNDSQTMSIDVSTRQHLSAQADTEAEAEAKVKAETATTKTKKSTSDPLGRGQPNPSPNGAIRDGVGNWTDRLVKTWEAHQGHIGHGKIGKLCKPLVDKYGADEVGRRFLIFAQGAKAAFGIGYFVEHYAGYATDPESQPVDLGYQPGWDLGDNP